MLHGLFFAEGADILALFNLMVWLLLPSIMIDFERRQFFSFQFNWSHADSELWTFESTFWNPRMEAIHWKIGDEIPKISKNAKIPKIPLIPKIPRFQDFKISTQIRCEFVLNFVNF